jgi:hypothetical protein
MQDIERLQSTRVQTPLSFKCNVVRESLSVDSQNIPCAVLKRRGSWVISVYLCSEQISCSRKYDPGFLSWILIFFQIGSRIKGVIKSQGGIPDPDPQQCSLVLWNRIQTGSGFNWTPESQRNFVLLHLFKSWMFSMEGGGFSWRFQVLHVSQKTNL